MNIKFYIALFFTLISPSYVFAKEGEIGFPQLDVSTYPSQIFWLVVTFGFLYVVVFVYFSPRLHKIAKNRSSYLSANLKKLVKYRDSLEKIEQKIKEENELKSKSVEDMNFKLKDKLNFYLEQETKLLEEDYATKHAKLLKEQSKLLETEKAKFGSSVALISQDILAKLNIQVDESCIKSFTEKETENYINKINTK